MRCSSCSLLDVRARALRSFDVRSFTLDFPAIVRRRSLLKSTLADSEAPLWTLPACFCSHAVLRPVCLEKEVLSSASTVSRDITTGLTTRILRDTVGGDCSGNPNSCARSATWPPLIHFHGNTRFTRLCTVECCWISWCYHLPCDRYRNRCFGQTLIVDGNLGRFSPFSARKSSG